MIPAQCGWLLPNWHPFTSLPTAHGAGLPAWGRVGASLATLLVTAHLGSVRALLCQDLCAQRELEEGSHPGPWKLPAVSRNAVPQGLPVNSHFAWTGRRPRFIPSFLAGDIQMSWDTGEGGDYLSFSHSI